MIELSKKDILDGIDQQYSREKPADPGAEIDICLAFDRNFVPHAAVTLVSAAKASKIPSKIKVHVLHAGDLGADEQAALEKLSPALSIRWHEVDSERFVSLPDNRDHVSLATYLRLFIPETLRGVASRVIYLDCDTIVTDDLAHLWAVDMKGAAIAAAPDEGGGTQAQRLELTEGTFYFNAGVLLFNLEAIDPVEFGSRAQSVVSERLAKLELQDQDILNLMFAGQVHRLHLRWNANTRLYTPNDLEPAYGPVEAREAVTAPGILHFTDRRKPWNTNCNHPLRELYWTLRNETPWRESKPQRVRRRIEELVRDRLSKSRKAVKIAR
ncbi:glycosyltransferase family 8 protein [Ruegeria sediminis]|uniref:Glycosyltransferase family 8 protein n=1 Tax=Ruegeria sediminis TaxID=2583820 RepID=A0ABY2X0N6_9RHOB|nr:glycosyltransferase family 8 protein [Ruegeria sediminis]TMV08448.1 glycosyltransferase family 8 protein [Ruegeria sediminis]